MLIYVSVEMDTRGVVSRVDYGAPEFIYNILIGLKLRSPSLRSLTDKASVTHIVWISSRLVYI